MGKSAQLIIFSGFDWEYGDKLVSDNFFAVKALWTHCGNRLDKDGVVTTRCSLR